MRLRSSLRRFVRQPRAGTRAASRARSVSTSSAYSRERAGRVLVECCVSVVLLAGGSTLVLLLATTTARLVQQTQFDELTQRESANRLAPLLASPCRPQAVVVLGAQAPHTLWQVTEQASPHTPVVSVRVTQPRSALDGGGMRTDSASVTGWCE